MLESFVNVDYPLLYGGRVPWRSMFPAPETGCANRVDLYDSSGGTEGTTLRDTGLPVIIETHTVTKPVQSVRSR